MSVVACSFLHIVLVLGNKQQQKTINCILIVNCFVCSDCNMFSSCARMNIVCPASNRRIMNQNKIVHIEFVLVRSSTGMQIMLSKSAQNYPVSTVRQYEENLSPRCFRIIQSSSMGGGGWYYVPKVSSLQLPFNKCYIHHEPMQKRNPRITAVI